MKKLTNESINQQPTKHKEKEKTMNNYDAIMNTLRNMDDGELVAVWNEYCYATNNYDDEIFNMDQLDEIFYGQDAQYVLNRAFFGHDQWSDDSAFNPNREWFTFNGYGNLISMDCIGYNEYADKFMCDYLDEDALCEYIADNNESFDNDSLEDVLAELKEGLC